MKSAQISLMLQAFNTLSPDIVVRVNTKILTFVSAVIQKIFQKLDASHYNY